MTLALLSASLSFYLHICFSVSVEPGPGTFLCLCLLRLCFPSSVPSQFRESPAQRLFPLLSVSPSQAWRWLSHTLSIGPDFSQTKYILSLWCGDLSSLLLRRNPLIYFPDKDSHSGSLRPSCCKESLVCVVLRGVWCPSKALATRCPSEVLLMVLVMGSKTWGHVNEMLEAQPEPMIKFGAHLETPSWGGNKGRAAAELK